MSQNVIKSMTHYITPFDDSAVLESIIEVPFGTIPVYQPYNHSENTITISKGSLHVLREHLGIEKDKAIKSFKPLELPNYCYITPYLSWYAIHIKSTNIVAIVQVIQRIKDWWFKNVNKLKKVEFPCKILINTTFLWRS